MSAGRRLDPVDRERALVVLRSARRALLLAQSETELLDLVCRIAVDEAGYRLVWVGLATDDPERTVRPVAHAGHEAGYLGSVAVSWSDTVLGQGPTGEAIRSGRPVIGRNFRTDPTLAPWREEALQRGYASSLALPLGGEEGAFGALTIYATTPDAFDPEDVDLLTGLADDLAFGITTHRARAAAEAGLRRSEHDLAEAQRIARIGSWTLDPLTGDASWSSQMYAILGLDPAGPALGLSDISRLFTDDSVRLVTAAVELAWRAGQPWQMELELRRPDGRPGWVASRGVVERDGTGAVVRIRGTMQDITGQVAAERERTRLETSLRRSERSLAAAQRIAHIGSWDWDLLTGAIERSEETHRIFGVEPGAFPGTNDAFLAFVHPEDRARVDASEQAAITGGERHDMDYRMVRPDGTVRIVHEQAELIRDASGTPVRLIGTAQDITGRRRLEAQQSVLARLLDEVSSEIYVFDAETLRFTGANAGALRNIGYTLDELSVLTPRDLRPDETPPAYPAALASLRSGAREQATFQTLHRRKDGSTYPVEVRLDLLARETPPAFVAVIQDVTERVAASEERAWLASAVDQTADAVWMKNVEGDTVTYVNRSFSRLYGYEPVEIVGRYAGILHSGRHDHEFFDAIWASVGQGSTWTGSIVNRRKDGSQIEVDSVISGIRDASGRLVAYMQTDRDVTRERALESVLARDAREREMIEASLARIDPADTPEAIAAAACAELVRLPDIDSAWAIGIGADHGRILAAAGHVGSVMASGTLVPGERARHLRERAATGPWSETWQARPEDEAYGQAISASGLHSAVYAPLTGPHGVIGVLGIGVDDPLQAERVIERLPALATFGSIVGALVAPGVETRHREDDARATVRGILDASTFTPFFQPIVEFHTGDVVGYEALSRFADGTSPDVMFRTAVRAGLGIELETATLGAALEAAAILPARAYLSLNASPELIMSRALAALLTGRERRIVLEITEHVAIDDYPALRAALTELGPTIRLAVDDAGAGYASLRHILELAPDFVKLDIGLIRGIDADPARQALIAGMGYFAVKRKLRLIAEGVETTAELETLRGLAIGYGQGFLLGRPQDGRGPGPWPTRIVLPTA